MQHIISFLRVLTSPPFPGLVGIPQAEDPEDVLLARRGVQLRRDDPHVPEGLRHEAPRERLGLGCNGAAGASAFRLLHHDGVERHDHAAGVQRQRLHPAARPHDEDAARVVDDGLCTCIIKTTIRTMQRHCCPHIHDVERKRGWLRSEFGSSRELRWGWVIKRDGLARQRRGIEAPDRLVGRQAAHPRRELALDALRLQGPLEVEEALVGVAAQDSSPAGAKALTQASEEVLHDRRTKSAIHRVAVEVEGAHHHGLPDALDGDLLTHVRQKHGIMIRQRDSSQRSSIPHCWSGCPFIKHTTPLERVSWLLNE